MRDLESNPSTPSGASHFPIAPHAELDPMITPSYYKKESERDADHPDLYTDEDVMNCAPEGWPAIASRQMFYPNAGIHRKFSNLMQRILVSFEIELDCIDHKFLDLDHADKHNGVLRTLPFDRHKFLDRCCGYEINQQQKHQPHTPIQRPLNGATEHLTRPRTAPEQQIQQSQNAVSSTNNHTSRDTGHREERAHLMNNARATLKEYHHFISMESDFQSMRRVSRKQHLVHYLAVTKDQVPSKAAHQYLWARDDFVNTDRDTVHQWFENILYITGPRVQRALCWLFPYFYKQEKVKRPTGEVEHRIHARRLRLLQKIIISFASAVVLLIPVGLMEIYADSSDKHRGKWVSYVIACVSTIVFLVVITSLETNYGRALVGVCAFVAVMASFLANLSGNGGGC